MKKQTQKMTKEETRKAERKAYLMSLVPAETLKKFTKKRAEKVADELAKAFGYERGVVSKRQDTWTGYWVPAFIRLSGNKGGTQSQIDCQTGKIERL